MTKNGRLLCACMLLCGPAAAQRPTSEEQSRTLSTVRAKALDYAKALPDFICTETIERTVLEGDPNQPQRRARLTTQQGDGSGPAAPKTDRLTLQLTYFQQKENYKLLQVNGQPTTASLESMGGLITEGEFGTLLVGVFSPESEAEFKWKGWSRIRDRRVAVYDYRVPREKSHFLVGYRTDDGKLVSIAAAYRGEVSLDGQTLDVLRLTAQANDIPRESGVLKSESSVDYDFVDVAGKKYLLPAKAETHMARTARDLRGLVTFSGYRKYEADSTIVYK